MMLRTERCTEARALADEVQRRAEGLGNGTMVRRAEVCRALALLRLERSAEACRPPEKNLHWFRNSGFSDWADELAALR